VSDIMAVSVQQDEVSRVMVGTIAVRVVNFQHVLYRETQSAVRATSGLLL
jgi:hypothetical protein